MITKVSKIMHRENKRIAVLITDKLKKIDFGNYNHRDHLAGWLNGIATMESNPVVKKEILEIRQRVKEIA